jgi:hypothetical protein
MWLPPLEQITATGAIVIALAGAWVLGALGVFLSTFIPGIW